MASFVPNFTPASEEELAAVVRIKEGLAAQTLDYSFTDTAVLRFLRGRKGEEEKALKGLVRHVAWREEMNITAITAEGIADEIAKRKIMVSGYDKQQRPCIYILANRHRTSERDLDVMRQYIIYTIERAMKRTRPEDEKLVIVFDLSGFTLSCMDYDVLKMLVNILQFNYPEVLSVALILDAPFLFWACWSIIKPWLDPVTAAKALFINKAQLTQYVDEQQIIFAVSGVHHEEQEQEEAEAEAAYAAETAAAVAALAAASASGGGGKMSPQSAAAAPVLPVAKAADPATHDEEAAATAATKNSAPA